MGDFEENSGKKRTGVMEELARGAGASIGSYLAAAVAPLAVMPLAIAGTTLDDTITREEAAKFTKQVHIRDGIKTKLRHIPMSDLSSAYSPMTDEAYVAMDPKRGTLAHELGHAASVGKNIKSKSAIRRALPVAYGIGRTFGGLAPAAALIAGGATGSTHIDDVAPYAGLALASPMLYEEGMASAKAIRNIYAINGGKAALKAIPGLAGAFGTYLAGPVAAGYVASRYLKNKRNRAMENQQMDKTAFWDGFEKRAYDYEHESSNLKTHYDQRSKETPVSASKAGLWGAGIGGASGAVMGAMHSLGKGKRMLPDMLLGGLVGAGIGGLTGVATAIADELGIEEAKRIMRMEDGVRQSYLKSLARNHEISEQQYDDWSRDLRRERHADARHNELVSAMKGRR